MYKDLVPNNNMERACFYGMISNIDDNIGILRQKLKDLNIEDDTILIFMTDNGTSGGVITDEYGFVIDGYGAGLRGQKNSEYEGGHRVPFHPLAKRRIKGWKRY